MKTRRAKPDSLGLGLYISREILAAHGGVIEVTSTLEEGTTFVAKLPRAAISGETRIGKRRQVLLCGAQAGRFGAARRRKLGLCFVPEERLGRGAVPEMSLSENALLTAHRRGFVKGGLIRFKAVARFAQTCIDKFTVKCGGPDAEAKSLRHLRLEEPDHRPEEVRLDLIWELLRPPSGQAGAVAE